MLYRVNSDGTVSFINRFSTQNIIACKRANVPVEKRLLSKEAAKRVIREWVATHS